MLYQYEKLMNGNVGISIICEENDSTREITIPALYQGARITKIIPTDFMYQDNKLEKIKISEHLTEGIEIDKDMHVFSGKSLQGIFVNRGNPVYADIDGVLFSKPDKRLVSYPYAKPGAYYAIPDGIITMAKCAFYFYNPFLRQIHIPDSIRLTNEIRLPEGLESINIPNGVDSSIFQYISPFPGSIKEVVISPTHPTLVNIAGTVYDRFRRRLIYAIKKSGDGEGSQIDIPEWVYEIGSNATIKLGYDFAIPEGIRQIGANSFTIYKPLRVTLPQSVVSIDKYAFSSCCIYSDSTCCYTIPIREILKLNVYAGTYSEKYAIDNFFSYECFGNHQYAHDWLK